MRALARRGYEQEAENLLHMLRQRISGDGLQTSAIVRGGGVISAVNDPNDYAGPGTGYRMSGKRWREVSGVRDVLTKEAVLATEDTKGTATWLGEKGPARKGSDPHEVVIGLSPAFGIRLHRTTAGHSLRGGRAAAPFWVMAKPMGPRCNLDCTYCYYLDKVGLYRDQRKFRMAPEVLETFIRDYIASQSRAGARETRFVWQAGSCRPPARHRAQCAMPVRKRAEIQALLRGLSAMLSL